MLLVETVVRPSPIEGLGLFACERIRAGQRIWTFAEGIDQLIPVAAIESLPPDQQAFFERYTYCSPRFPGFVVLEVDNARFMNHSNDPNTDFSAHGYGIARRDIEPMTEITCNYAEFETKFEELPPFRQRLGVESFLTA